MTPKENMIRTIHRDHPQWVPNGMESVISITSPVNEHPRDGGRDAFGVLWDADTEGRYDSYPAPGRHVITDLLSWREQLKIPDLDIVDWCSISQEAEQIDRSKFLVSGFVEMGLFERSYLLLGMENALIGYIEEPDVMAAFLNKLADFKIEVIKRFHNACHLDIIWYGDDWGMQQNLFMPVSFWRKTIRPATQRIYDCMKRQGIMINQHSCGKIDSIASDIVEMGADMLNPLQPVNDLPGMKHAYGENICFIGGIDSQFVLDKPGATAEDVKREVKLRIDQMAGGGGYIAAPSHTVPYNKVLLAAMNDAIEEYGRYH